MRYYSEEEMSSVRLALEGTLMAWPHVGTRKMYGCPCYRAKGKLFAFLVTDALVLTHMTEKDREALSRTRATGPFQAGNRTIRAWVQIPVRQPGELEGLLPLVRKSYAHALRKPKGEGRPHSAGRPRAKGR